MQRSIAATLFLASTMILGFAPCRAQDTAESEKQPIATKQISSLMQMKLDKSKAILEGLALEDYKAIAENARGLHLLSLESGWNVIQTPEYTKQSSEFKRSCDVIAEAAEQHDLGRATLGFVALTVRCVECHIYLRKQRSGGGKKTGVTTKQK
jgi:hypothetical protein